MKANFFPVIISLTILFIINLLMISSVAPQLLLKQIIAWTISIILFFIGLQFNPRQTTGLKWPFFVTSCILLFVPIILNNITRGSRRWIDLWFISLQPSEIVKPFLMLFLSSTIYPILHIIPVLIIMLQPDLGSAMSVFFLIIPIILYNKKLFYFSIIGVVCLLLLSPLIWKYGFHQYQRNRIITFINPSHDPLGKGYNVIQSQIAIGSGGLFGKGYKKGTQGQLLFLPEKHTDFIFAATAEETGLFGIAIIVLAYYFLIKNLLVKAFHTSNRILFLFTLGIAFQIWFQVMINAGMNIGILPVTGIPLPFLSVGGSSLMAYMFSLGVIFSN